MKENQIQELPNNFVMLQSLEYLDARHNPITFPPQNVIARGPPAIKEFLRDYFTASEEWNQVKIITIGDEHVGKVRNFNEILKHERLQ